MLYAICLEETAAARGRCRCVRGGPRQEASRRRQAARGRRQAVGARAGRTAREPALDSKSSALHAAADPLVLPSPCRGLHAAKHCCPRPGGSAHCHWNSYGTQCNHPAQGLTEQPVSSLPSRESVSLYLSSPMSLKRPTISLR